MTYFLHFLFRSQETLNDLTEIALNANSDVLQKITSFGYAIQSSAETPITNNLPDFPCDNLKLIAQISSANPSASPFELLYRLYPFDSFIPKESHGGLMSLFDAFNITTEKTESTSWIRNLWQKNDGQKIVSVERPARLEALLDGEANLQHHKGNQNST